MLDFLGIGAQKSGTSWLRYQLNKHPQIRCAEELHFWDEQRHRGVSWWLSLFPDDKEVKHGEITPAYAILDRVTIAEIRSAAPHARLFYSLRNPIDRAWSHARMALKLCKMELHEASDQWFVDHFKSRASRSRGGYAACIEAWRNVFPAEQLRIVMFDDIVSRPRAVLHDLATHLGANPAPFAGIAEHELDRVIFPGPEAALRPSLRDYLRDLYASDVMRLEPLLGIRLSHWLSEPRQS